MRTVSPCTTTDNSISDSAWSTALVTNSDTSSTPVSMRPGSARPLRAWATKWRAVEALAGLGSSTVVVLSPLVVGALFWAMPDGEASGRRPSVIRVKIAIVGGGSYQWSARLVSDILNLPALADADIVLEDIDPAPLPKMAEYCGKLAAHLGVGATFSTTTDQRAALDGADFVIVTISTGGFQSMAHDLGVPARHGILQSVGDTVGPGGIARSLRNIPVLVGIARDMQEVAPDGW